MAIRINWVMGGWCHLNLRVPRPSRSAAALVVSRGWVFPRVQQNWQIILLTPILAQVLAGQESSLQPPVAQVGDGPEKPRPVTCQGGNCSGPWRECPGASGSLLRGLYFEELTCLAEGRQRMAWADVRAGDLQPACFTLDKHFPKTTLRATDGISDIGVAP